MWDQASSAVLCLSGSAEYLTFPSRFAGKNTLGNEESNVCNSGNLSPRNTLKPPYFKGDQKTPQHVLASVFFTL